LEVCTAQKRIPFGDRVLAGEFDEFHVPIEIQHVAAARNMVETLWRTRHKVIQQDKVTLGFCARPRVIDVGNEKALDAFFASIDGAWPEDMVIAVLEGVMGVLFRGYVA
jgi:hypothetical protein